MPFPSSLRKAPLTYLPGLPKMLRNGTAWEENLRLDKERFRRILANMPDVSWTSDQNGRTVYISPNVEEILGFSNQEIYANGKHLFIESLHPDDLDRVRSAFKALFETQTTFDEEFRIRNKSGQWVWVHDRAIRTHAENGILYADGTLSDITPRKEAELDLQSKTALLEAQVNSTIDGILIVDPSGQRILQNKRFTEIFNIPSSLLEQTDDRLMLNYVVGLMKSPEEFLAKVEYLYAHPMETSRDEIELKGGVILDRYSSPVVDKNGKYYGRIWTFRDISERKETKRLSASSPLQLSKARSASSSPTPKGTSHT